MENSSSSWKTAKKWIWCPAMDSGLVLADEKGRKGREGGSLMDIEKLIHCLQCCARVDAHNIGCDDCWLEYCGTECQQLCGTAATALEQLQAENDRLRRERSAVVKDTSDLIDEVEEIRRGYGIDDSDADKALADMCGNYCENEGDGCYIEGEKYHCENFKWRGPQKEE